MSRFGYQTATHSIGTVTTSNGTVLAASASRLYALIINDSDTTIYLGFGGAASLNQGVRLNPGGASYEMRPGDGEVYTGNVQAIHNGSGNKLLLITEGSS